MDAEIIKMNRKLYIQNQINRFLDATVIDTIINDLKIFNSNLQKSSDLRALLNTISKEIDIRIKNKTDVIDDCIDLDAAQISYVLLGNYELLEKYNIEQLKMIVSHVKKVIKIIEENGQNLEQKLFHNCSSVPNIIHQTVPISKDENENKIIFCSSEQNQEIRENLIKTFLTNDDLFNPVTYKYSHYELLEKLDFVDCNNGIKISGNRGYFLKGLGVKLNLALLTFATDFLVSRGFTLMETPEFVNGDLLSKCSQLSDYEDMLYKLEGYDKYLIATSEQSLTASFADTILEIKDLPQKLGGLSTCFRKETGCEGKNTNGIYRVHQFKKVEQFCVTKPEESWNMFNEMINNSKDFYDALGISYRVVNIVSGALNNAAAMKYDLEAWYPGSKSWCKLVSGTNCTDYFSKRMNTKVERGVNYFYPHMLNSTLCANTRTLCCLVECYQTTNGIVVPEVLRPFMNDIDFIPFAK